MNIHEISEALNEKLDLDYNNGTTTFRPVPPSRAAVSTGYLKQVVQNGTSGYAIYSDGYCKQWGRTDAISYGVTQTITLSKAYKDLNYNIAVAGTYKQGNGDVRTSISFEIESTKTIIYRATQATYVLWRTEGYLATGEY